MKKYYITIITRATMTHASLERTEEDINKTIEKELGGWDNLHSAMTSGALHNDDEFFTAGTTKDNAKAFSILCVKA